MIVLLLLLAALHVSLSRGDGQDAVDGSALDDRGLERFRRAAHLAVDAVRRRGVQRVTAFVCWGRENAFLYRLLSSAGMTSQFLRGAESTRAASLRAGLSEGFYSAAIIVDASCPNADKFLDLASRLRLFHLSNTWVIFESGLLGAPADAAVVEVAVEGEFDDAQDIPVRRFGAQDRASAVDPDEEAFLEISPPSSPRARHGLLAQDTESLSDAALSALDNKVVFVDSDVIWVQRSGERVEAFEVFRSCLARPLQGYLVAVSEGEGLRWRWTMDVQREDLLRERRADLQGATLRGSTIIKFPEEYTHIEDNSLRQNDLYPKMNWPVTQNLAYSLNFGMLVYKRDTYGWDDGQGVFDGMVGEMQRYDHDMLATSVFIRADRLAYMDLSAETFGLRTAVLFRQPSKSSVSNVYALPFSPGVWRATGAVCLLAMLLLIVQTQWWRAHHAEDPLRPDPSDHLEVGDCITFIVGAFSQQGFFCTPSMVSARITFITTFVANLFLFTSFSGSIVAIIQSQSHAFRTVRDLLGSEMHMGVQDIRFQHVWFQEAEKDHTDVAGEVFRSKIRSHDRPGFVSTQEGIRRVRHGMYAFQVETNEGYREILDTFLESDKCDLAEAELFPAAPMVFCTTEKSPYREAVTRNIRWQRETGLLDRIRRRWESPRPVCAGQVSTFVAIGLQEFYPALIVLYNGVLLSLFIFCVERVSRAKWCCGFSTYEDVSVLEERDHQVLGYVEDVKHAVVQVHSEQQRHANAVNSLVKQVNAAFALDRSALSATKDNVQILRMRLTQMALSVASLASIGTDKLLNAERMYSIHAACSAGLIPMEAVRHEDLLRAAQQVLELYKGQVRVSVSDLELLYKLEIATCVFSGADRLSVVAKLPLLPANQDWHVYDVAPLGFLYHLDTGGPSVCRLLPREVMVAMSADDLHVRVMSRQQRADCLKKNLCEVPRTGEAEGVSRDCIRGVKRVFQNRNESLEALRKVCSFTCAPYRGVEVTHVENNWYSLVNMDRALVVSCPGRDYVELPPVAEGALFVEVPCQCEVLDVTDASKTRPAVLVSTVEPCHPKLSTEVSVEIKVPALWTSDQEMLAALTHQVANGSKLTTPSTSRAVSIDQDWVIKIETLSQQGPLNISALHAPALTSTRFAEASVGVLALPAWLSNLWLAALSVAVLVVHLHARCARRRAVQPVIFAPGADYNCAKK